MEYDMGEYASINVTIIHTTSPIYSAIMVTNIYTEISEKIILGGRDIPCIYYGSTF